MKILDASENEDFMVCDVPHLWPLLNGLKGTKESSHLASWTFNMIWEVELLHDCHVRSNLSCHVTVISFAIPWKRSRRVIDLQQIVLG